MPSVDLVVESAIAQTPRVRQLGSMFDCPVEDKQRLQWTFDFPFDAEPWNVGLIVGPSGSGKSSVMREVFGSMPAMKFEELSLIDDFSKDLSIEDIAKACQAVGFNTIPAWMRPHAVLSNGEQFRVDVARRMLELPSPIVVDEFTSVVDRQVAQVGSHSVQKFVRRSDKQFVAVTCHYDVIDWLQPDWVLDMATCHFTRRSLQRRPEIECVVGRLPYSAWSLFAPFHYMTAELNRSARCFGLWADGNLAVFAGIIHRPHPKTKNIKAISRIVTLPDFQGLGLSMALSEHLAAAYKGVGFRMRSYPTHPAHVRALDRSPTRRMIKEPGTFATANAGKGDGVGKFGGRPNAVFEYCGEAMDRRAAERLLATG